MRRRPDLHHLELHHLLLSTPDMDQSEKRERERERERELPVGNTHGEHIGNPKGTRLGT